jgi:hypothetical protein
MDTNTVRRHHRSEVARSDIELIIRLIEKLRQEVGASRRRMMDINETAAYLAISVRTIRNEMSRRVFPIKPKKYRSKLLWDVRDVDKFIDNNLGEGGIHDEVHDGPETDQP